MLLTSFLILFAVVIALSCSKHLRMSVPTNYILLAVATLAESIFVAAVCQGYTTESVLLSIGILSLTVLSLFIAALFTPLSPKLAIFLIAGLIVSCLL